MYFIAHRGYPNLKYKDNSFEAYNNAINNDFHLIEMDIQLCKSGEIILYHDIYLKNRLIQDIHYDEIKKYDIKTLRDFFDNIYKQNMKLLFDIKGGHDNLIVDKILILCNKYNVNYNNIYMSSFNKRIIEKLIEYKKVYNYTLGLISDNNFYYDEIKYQLNKIDFISINFEMFLICDKELINECKNQEIKIFIWTIKNKNQYELIKNFNNIDGIISDIKLS